jgi:7-carboxy-7-deazaguanine synthase
MKISEIFYSIQGEGLLLGTPSVFVRTSGCNLRCTWCDTPYTSWQPEGEDRSMDAIGSEISRNPGVRHVVITGGEPMLTDDVIVLTGQLKQLGLHITMETSGTVYRPVSCELMSISPKLANSTPHERDGGRWAAQHERLRYQPGVLRRLLAEYPYQLKFVVQSEEDMDEIHRIIEQTGAERSRVVLMPEGTNASALHERALWIAEICKRERFHFSPRLHVDLWGDKRGV